MSLQDVNSPLPCSSGSFSSAVFMGGPAAALASAMAQPHHELSPVDEGAVRSRAVSAGEHIDLYCFRCSLSHLLTREDSQWFREE